MKKLLAMLLVLSLLSSFCLPSAWATGVVVGELMLSQQSYAPTENGRLYIYLPVQLGAVDCTLTIYDASGRVIAQFVRDNLTVNTHTFIWDAHPAEGNAAGYAPDIFVPDGLYMVEALCTSGSENIRRMATVTIAANGETAQPEQGIPNYTGDSETDYMVSCILEEIPTDGLSTVEKIRAVYTWVQENCYRTGETEIAYFDLDALAPIIEAEGTYYDNLHASGQINYDVLDNLYTSNAKTLLLYRVGSCLEFSALVQVLLARLGIECWIVGGDFYNSDGSVVIHKWNYIRIDGAYYWSDVRIDNASYERSERTQLFYDYFLEMDTDLWAERHGWDREEFPERSTKTPALSGYVPDLPQEDLPQDTQEESIFPEEDLTFGADETNGAQKTVTANTAPVFIDGVEYAFEAYTIDGYNYVKLRDLAFVLTGTAAQFEVVWLEEQNAVGLFSGYPYTPAGNELTVAGTASAEAILSPCTIYADGEPVALSAYLIDANNYFRLRDIGMLFNFAVNWDAGIGTILIDTTSPYGE